MNRGALAYLATALGLGSVLCAGFFIDRYWLRRDCFDETGVCYDPVAGATFTSGSFGYGPAAVLTGLACLYVLHRMRVLKNA
ncbi:hypothetical protein [Gymnodinialimonas hymeniacidonis]|uniref:hypothetical protein n=1 Tax=Gymnodinialimonas hymeniacidonis TaxID=3126508 RepID=UPI0034C5F425